MNFALGDPATAIRDARTEIAWKNGSRALSLPDSPSGVVGFTPRLIVIDEGARVSDELYYSVLPMLALGDCEIDTLSTPFGQRGWFFKLWDDLGSGACEDDWETHKITADKCPRISRDELVRQERELGPRWFKQEFYCSFENAVDAVFSKDVIDAAMDDEVKPLFE